MDIVCVCVRHLNLHFDGDPHKVLEEGIVIFELATVSLTLCPFAIAQRVLRAALLISVSLALGRQDNCKLHGCPMQLIVNQSFAPKQSN